MEIQAYFVNNWEIILPFLLIIFETILRKIPTFKNISLISNFNKILNVLIGNKSLLTGRNGREVGNFESVEHKVRQ